MVLPNLGRSVMSDLQFSRAEIESLAQKLDSMQEQLSEREKQLLLAIFAAAGNHVRSSKPKDSGGADITLADLLGQLLIAFSPDDGGEFFIISINEPPPPPPPTTRPSGGGIQPIK
jgi:hypothetical protein